MLKKPLRNAASMIVLARDASKSSRYDYKVILQSINNGNLLDLVLINPRLILKIKIHILDFNIYKK
jgi:hypothetical protein